MDKLQTASAQMKTIVRHCVGLAAGVVSWACNGLAEEAANLLSVDDILKRNVEAFGGEKAMRKLKNRVARGNIELAVFGAKLPVVMRQTSPNKEMMELTIKLKGVEKVAGKKSLLSG